MISRGGYGLTRILADLPYAALVKAIESGTQFVGLSDFTALQLGLMTLIIKMNDRRRAE